MLFFLRLAVTIAAVVVVESHGVHSETIKNNPKYRQDSLNAAKGVKAYLCYNRLLVKEWPTDENGWLVI